MKEKVDDMTPQQRAWFDAFVKRYVAKTAKSKAFTQENRKPMADPRVVTGFKPQTKELIYQVVVDKSVRLPPVGHRRQRVRGHPQRLRQLDVRLHARLHQGSLP
jgi:hypothetical protein